MTLTTRLGLLLLAMLGCLFLQQQHLAGPDPTERTALALRQFDSDDGAAEALRSAEASRGWAETAWPVLVVVLLAAVLFADDLRRAFALPSAREEVVN